jgi:hypothetical protein
MLVCPSWFLILFKWGQIYTKLSFFLGGIAFPMPSNASTATELATQQTAVSTRLTAVLDNGNTRHLTSQHVGYVGAGTVDQLI